MKNKLSTTTVLLYLIIKLAHGQDLKHSCLTKNNQKNNLELTMDTIGDLHLSHVAQVTKHLYYTHIGPNKMATNKIITNRIALFPNNQIMTTNILVNNDEIHICFHDQQHDRFHLATRSDNE